MELIFSTPFHMVRGENGKKEYRLGTKPAPMPEMRIPRVTRLTALALHFQNQIETGQLRNQSEIAQVSGASVSQVSLVLSLCKLSPEIIEAILFLPRVVGKAPIVMEDLRKIRMAVCWREQRRLWRHLLQRKWPALLEDNQAIR